MKSIFIPFKTYNLYVNGHRTFIHVSREHKSELEKLKFGEIVRIVNQENEQEFTDEIFWFLYSFKEIERFIFLSFECKVKSNLHWKRMNNAKMILKFSTIQSPYKIHVDMNYQRILHRSVRAYSLFFFITDDIAMPISQLIEDGLGSENYIVVNELRIKTGPDLKEIISVYSMIPMGLLYI
jgi:hypothetical protein